MLKRFVIHEHHATRLHWDLRLEMGGVYKSWAVPKGVSMNPEDKRLAVAVGDHTLEYGKFEGIIPEGNYGAGRVAIWDKGAYECDDPPEQFKKGKISFTIYGEKIRGGFTLVKMYEDEKNWLIIKGDDEFADEDWELKTVLKPMKRRDAHEKFDPDGS